MASGVDSPLVLVTGATGFVSTHVIKLLQGEGYKVRGTVRNLKDEDKVKQIRELSPDAQHPIELVEADLTKDEGWNEAVKDCSYVIHIASPVPSSPPVNEDDILQPIVEGTKRVLQACADAGTIKRVVLTSSTFAIHGETTLEEDKVYNESDWTDTESTTLDSYSKSKTLGEKGAWEFIKELPDDKKFELAVINPGLVLGPVLSSTVSSSNEIVKKLLERGIPMVPRINLSVCDVRDVAEAHLKAMTTPSANGQRYIISTQNVWLKDIALILCKEFKPQGYRIPTMNAPYFALWLNSFIDKSVRPVLPRIGKEYKFDNTRMKEVLEINPLDLTQTIVDTAYSLIEHGIVKKSKKYKQGKKEEEDQPVEEKKTEEEIKQEGKSKEKVENNSGDKNEKEKPTELEPEDKPEKVDDEQAKSEIEATEK
ncbi:cinnamoyl-CoA reductase 1-like isoform X2 [Limulus polyphemus]|uniref:Cinnamoyl-CoA reductase 1-like isoform X2 n=1 Tax=Limulus polyphemus TaxID=6850 RepID=A0ABM1SL34_LIMPO|nr:cinnamoyl-CoA reductase 1-like isoform X2 [Limulus polyphemus]